MGGVQARPELLLDVAGTLTRLKRQRNEGAGTETEQGIP
jgi:hypothetical protein